MKTYHRILVLLLIVTLGTTSACSSDDNTKTNNTNTSDSGLVDTDDKDVDETKTDVDETDDKDVEETKTDVDETDDKDVDDHKDDTELPPDPEENKTPLKDLTDEQIIEICSIDTDNVNDFFDPANDTGTAYCLLFAAYSAYDQEKTPAEIIGVCETTMASCTGDDGSSNEPRKCINQTGCNATVADFERCSNDNIAAFAFQTSTLLGKTCSDYTTEEGYQSLDIAVDAYEYATSCNDLIKKCPRIYTFPE